MTTPTITVVIPAYNEAKRLPAILESTTHYLQQQFSSSFEIIVVDDGSIDGLASVICSTEARLLRHDDNRGKGAAVRTGVLAARGSFVLVADADGATPISEELSLRDVILDGADIAVGSRFAPSDKFRQRELLRGLTGHAFAAIARAMFGLPVLDTQCGFKMFRRPVAQHLFRLSIESGFLLDIEVLLLAKQFNYKFAEVPVSWQEISGSKLNLVSDSAAMVAGLYRLHERFCRISFDIDPELPTDCQH